MIDITKVPTGKSRVVYIVLGLMFGYYGFHDFYAGRYLQGFCLLGAYIIMLGRTPLSPWCAAFICFTILFELCMVRRMLNGETVFGVMHNAFRRN